MLEAGSRKAHAVTTTALLTVTTAALLTVTTTALLTVTTTVLLILTTAALLTVTTAVLITAMAQQYCPLTCNHCNDNKTGVPQALEGSPKARVDTLPSELKLNLPVSLYS